MTRATEPLAPHREGMRVALQGVAPAPPPAVLGGPGRQQGEELQRLLASGPAAVVHTVVGSGRRRGTRSVTPDSP